MMNPSLNYSQCIPGDATTCPDTENNGEVCPAILPNGIIGNDYSQEFTILAPPEYDWNDQIIPLHHLKIVDVTNLPPGITWQTNATDSVFMVGTYYCVLLSGISSEVGNYPLKIVVDVYIDFLGNPIYATQVADSTSISLKITWDPNGVENYRENELAINIWPNPFQNDIFFELPDANGNIVDVELFSVLGNNILSKQYKGKLPGHKYSLDCSHLPNGTYFLKVNTGSKHVSKLIRKVH